MLRIAKVLALLIVASGARAAPSVQPPLPVEVKNIPMVEVLNTPNVTVTNTSAIPVAGTMQVTNVPGPVGAGAQPLIISGGVQVTNANVPVSGTVGVTNAAGAPLSVRTPVGTALQVGGNVNVSNTSPIPVNVNATSASPIPVTLQPASGEHLAFNIRMVIRAPSDHKTGKFSLFAPFTIETLSVYCYSIGSALPDLTVLIAYELDSIKPPSSTNVTGDPDADFSEPYPHVIPTGPAFNVIIKPQTLQRVLWALSYQKMGLRIPVATMSIRVNAGGPIDDTVDCHLGFEVTR